MKKKEALEALSRIFDYCEERTGYSMSKDIVPLKRYIEENGMIELKFEYFRNMEEVVESFLRNGYKVTIEDLIDKRSKQWKHLFLLTAEKTEPKEITGETE